MTFQKALSFLSPYIPAALAIKGLGKVSPELESFVTSAAAGGYSTDSILGFLRNKLEAPGYSQEQNRLEQGQQQGSLRPDEAASMQRTSERERIPRAVGAGLSAAGAVAAPYAASAASSALGGGAQQQQGEQKSQQAQPKQGFDALSGLQEFPELIKFIQDEQASGGNAQSISSKARKSMRLRTSVETIEQTANEPFENLLARLLGSDQQQAQPKQQSSQTPKLNRAMELLQKRIARRG